MNFVPEAQTQKRERAHEKTENEADEGEKVNPVVKMKRTMKLFTLFYTFCSRDIHFGGDCE